MKKKFRVVKNFKIVKQSCSLNRYYRVGAEYSFGVKNIEIWVPAFFKHNNSSVATVVYLSLLVYLRPKSTYLEWKTSDIRRIDFSIFHF